MPSTSGVEAELARLTQALSKPLGAADVQAGWTEQTREFWAGYFKQLDLEVATRVADDEFDYGWVNASHHLVRWLDHETICGGPLWTKIANFQGTLIDRAHAMGLN